MITANICDARIPTAISYYVFHCLQVINLYIELLKEREKREPNRFLKCHFFNTFFYKKVLDFRFTYCMHKYPLKCWSYYIIFETYGFILHRKQKHCHLGFDIWLMNGSVLPKMDVI
jgi:hypothetical protein